VVTFRQVAVYLAVLHRDEVLEDKNLWPWPQKGLALAWSFIGLGIVDNLSF